jgi:hypothetical protein
MKPVPIDAAANLLTRQARQAGANPLNRFQHFRLLSIWTGKLPSQLESRFLPGENSAPDHFFSKLQGPPIHAYRSTNCLGSICNEGLSPPGAHACPPGIEETEPIQRPATSRSSLLSGGFAVRSFHPRCLGT